MDKQKQIEGITRALCGNFRKGVKGDNLCGQLALKCECKCKHIARAENLYNAGYRKIPENAVVLTGTKAEEHFVDLLTEFDEMGFHPETTVPYPMVYADEWKRRMLYAIGQLRKETAEKFADMAKELLDKQEKGWSANMIWIITAKNCIEEICKEFTEGNND